MGSVMFIPVTADSVVLTVIEFAFLSEASPVKRHESFPVLFTFLFYKRIITHNDLISSLYLSLYLLEIQNVF